MSSGGRAAYAGGNASVLADNGWCARFATLCSAVLVAFSIGYLAVAMLTADGATAISNSAVAWSPNSIGHYRLHLFSASAEALVGSAGEPAAPKGRIDAAPAAGSLMPPASERSDVLPGEIAVEASRAGSAVSPVPDAMQETSPSAAQLSSPAARVSEAVAETPVPAEANVTSNAAGAEPDVRGVVLSSPSVSPGDETMGAAPVAAVPEAAAPPLKAARATAKAAPRPERGRKAAAPAQQAAGAQKDRIQYRSVFETN